MQYRHTVCGPACERPSQGEAEALPWGTTRSRPAVSVSYEGLGVVKAFPFKSLSGAVPPHRAHSSSASHSVTPSITLPPLSQLPVLGGLPYCSKQIALLLFYPLLLLLPLHPTHFITLTLLSSRLRLPSAKWGFVPHRVTLRVEVRWAGIATHVQSS